MRTPRDRGITYANLGEWRSARLAAGVGDVALVKPVLDGDQPIRTPKLVGQVITVHQCMRTQRATPPGQPSH
jgi:hypothetical protein